MQSGQTIEPYHIDTNLPVEGYCESRIGGRNENQDSYGYQDTPFGLLVVVCDGMGGGPAGKTASSIAVNEILAGVMETAQDSTPKDVLQLAIKRANQAILKTVDDKPELKGMGTTCTALLINKESAIVAHVGDSRVYQLRGHHKVFRTFDHSVVFEMVKKKVITEEQARLSDQSNIITRALGIKKELEIDMEERPYRKGDRFMLCSDGIHGTMPEVELVKRAMSRGRLDKVVDDLAKYVDDQGHRQGGGHDNLTLALVETKTGSLLKEKNQFKTTIALAIIAAVLAIAALLLNSCKNKDIEVATFKIESERVSPSADTVGIVGTYDFPVEARRMDVNIGLEEDLSDATSHRVAVTGKDYSVTMRGLLPATTYYYCYSADFGLKSELMTETRSFTTSEHVGYRIKVLSDPAWGGTVNGGGDYEEGQTCTVFATPAEGYVFSFWKESGIPIIQDASYTFEVTESRILVARFAEIAALPVVVTGDVTDITGTTTVGHGEVVSEGDSEVTERGVCWAVHHMPTTSDSHAGNGAGIGAYTAEMTGLLLDTIYYVRAYAINSEGTAYGEEKSFINQQANYTISVSVNPSNGGTISGGGSYQHGQSCTVLATANTGYTFVNWTENGNQVSANANYTFTVNGNRTLVANFSADSYTISATVDPENSGTITGAGNYEYGQSCTLSATANSGYTFSEWTENGNQVSTSANYTFTVNSDRTLVAHFTANPQNYTITISADPTNGGSVSGGGSFQQGQTCTVLATANNGYSFANWTENGNVVSTNANYSFAVNGNRTLVGNFVVESSGYLQYCTETFSGGVGTGGGAVYWGVRFPAADLAAYAGQNLTKVGNFMDVDGDHDWTYSGYYTVNVFLGGTTAPGTLVSSTTEYLPGDMAWHDITLTTPVTIDGSQDLWLTFYTSDIAYPMSGCDYVGNANSDFLSLNGVTWEHSTAYALNYTWMIRGWVSDGRGGESCIELRPNSNNRHTPSNGKKIRMLK